VLDWTKPGFGERLSLLHSRWRLRRRDRRMHLHNQSSVPGDGFGPGGVLHGKSLLERQRPTHRQVPPAPSLAL